MKISIVGPEESKWIPKQKIEAKAEIERIFFKRGLVGYTFEEQKQGDYIGLTHKYNFGDTILVSGHCPKGGVDIWAEEIADKLGIKKEIYPATAKQWNDQLANIFCDKVHGWEEVGYTATLRLDGYKSRNIKIAKACDVLYCVVPKTFDSVSFGSIPYGMLNKTTYCNHCKVWEHPTNGGCWTMKYAKKLGKETHLVVIK
jgi:hypothetical protein